MLVMMVASVSPVVLACTLSKFRMKALLEAFLAPISDMVCANAASAH
mgnify:CR=1 FL=1